MLSLLDNLLRKILMDGVTGLGAVPMPPLSPGLPMPPAPVVEGQVGFQPPDDQWVQAVTNMQLNALNVFLVDLRENRKLRSNERIRTPENGVVYEDPAPARLDCHYLLSAWSSTERLTPTVEPIFDEHALLYEATAVLMHNAPFNPSRVYPANSGPLNAWPVRFREVELPAVVAPVEGFPKLAEFWGTMGTNHRWKPVLYLVITVPVELVREVAGPMVTTRITEYRLVDNQEPGEVWIQIGGHVINAKVNPHVPVAGAWVGLETTAGELVQTTETNEQGRFTFNNLQVGRYRLRVRAVGWGELTPPRVVDVPSPTGEYDLHFT